MNFHAPHVGFVIAAYAIGFVVISGMIALTLLDYRSLKKRLERLSARGRDARDVRS